MKTRNYLTLMMVVVLIPVLVFAFWGLELLLQEEREARIGMVKAKARAIALDIDQKIAQAEGMLRVLANTRVLNTGNDAALYALMAKEKTNDAWIVLYDYDGRVVLSTYSPYGTRVTGARDWVKAAIDSQGISVSNLRMGLLNNGPVVSVNVPIVTSSGEKYLLAQVFPPSHFNKMIGTHDNPESWIAGLLDADGITIARSKDMEKVGDKPIPEELSDAIRRQSEGKIQTVSRDGIPIYAVFNRTDRTGWTVVIGVPVAEIETPARRAAYYGALAMGIVFGLAALTVLFLGRRLTKAFDEAVDSARILGKGRVPDITRSNVYEVDILQSALHDAGVSLAEENQSRQILERERERLLRSEQEARKHAEDQNKAKDEFLAMLAHELRNPLAPISAAADILKIAGTNETMVRHSSEVIARQVKHMTDLVDDLLDVSRVTRGLVELEKEQIDIKTVVSHAIEQARPLIEARGHEFKLRMDSAQAYVLGDKTRLVQVISNLLNNAAKYTPQGGSITLVVEVQDRHVTIGVTDNGVGIEASLLPHVFELFRQAERTPDRSQGGLGLGLALVKSIMSLHGGKVEAYSDGPGKGSTFMMTLPILAPENGYPTKVENNPLNTENMKRFTIMLVDDNLDAVNSLASLLKAIGHHVVVEEDGRRALKKAAERPAKIYILDIGLPDLDGYELARQLRAQPGNANAVLIALTGYGQAHDRVLSKAAGFDHHFVKPMDLNALGKILNQIDSESFCN